MSQSKYLDGNICPPQSTPSVSDATAKLHSAIDQNSGMLHPTSQSITFDLKSSANVIAWQEAKAEAHFLEEKCWVELPAFYGRYGSPQTQRLVDTLKTVSYTHLTLPTKA